MPPLNSQSALATPSAQLPVHNNGAPFANYPAWNNRLPESFKKLDRQFVLQSDNGKFLEMHPNGIRGVPKITDYCILYIFILNTTLNTGKSQVAPHLANFENPSAARRMSTNQTAPLKVFQSSTGNYLCMDNKSVIYQQETYDPDSCSFHHEYDLRTFRDRYYRLSTEKSKHKKRPTRWFVGINKDGTIRCGNVTRKKQQGANYVRIEMGTKKTSESPPYEGMKRKCCPKNKCKRRNGNKKRIKEPHKTETTTEKPTKRKRCYRNWCRKHRRQFFQLKLKDVNRYYNRCIKRKAEIRKCKNR